MAVINQVLVEVLHVVERGLKERNLGGTQTSSLDQRQTSATSTVPMSTPSPSSPPGNGPTSSPLLFFVALGFGVVFTNLWIIVGVKYCFRYNARNRAIRNGEEVDPINLENMPTRPHRRRREKKLMTMDEVNERFPLTKYKNWMAARAREGLPTSGGVTAPPSRAGSVRNVDGVMPSSLTETKHSAITADRPESPESGAEVTATKKPEELGTEPNKTNAEKKHNSTEVANKLEEVQTTQTTGTALDKTTSGGDDDDDEDDHIHTAVPPELLTNPGDTCAICIDTLEEDDDIRGLTCGHAFHAGCLDPWLTSRRACCPLCKADYYTPKPRPEGETVDADRTGRRSNRANMPQVPQSAWTGIRGNPRYMLSGRFGSATVYQTDQATYDQNRRNARRARRPAGAAQASGAVQDSPGATETADTTAPRRWVPRISNPFSAMSMPAMRIPGRQRQMAEPTVATEASPSQLEAGVVR